MPLTIKISIPDKIPAKGLRYAFGFPPRETPDDNVQLYLKAILVKHHACRIERQQDVIIGQITYRVYLIFPGSNP